MALAAILSRIVDDKEQGMKILLDHPETKDRIAAITPRRVASRDAPLLDARGMDGAQAYLRGRRYRCQPDRAGNKPCRSRRRYSQ